MSKSADKSAAKSGLSIQTIVFAGCGWAVVALLFFLLFSVPEPGKGLPLWYSIGTSIFELVAYLAATILCFRNWQSNQIVSGRTVWLAFALGMLSYFLGTIVFTLWETGWGQEAAVTPGDFFYVLTYLCLVWGILQAVISRRLNLEMWQWGTVGLIAAVGIAFAVWVAAPSATPTTSQAPAWYSSVFEAPAIAQTPTKSPAQKTQPAAAKPKASPAATAKPTPKPAAATPKAASPAASPSTAPAKAPELAEVKTEALFPVPDWVEALEKQLAPLQSIINLFYVVADVVLLILATMLLLAFWGGKSSRSWQVIAIAAFFLYLADMWFKYATTKIVDYKSGSLPEVAWVFFGVLFGIGAALEYDLSTRSSRRSGGRRRAS